MMTHPAISTYLHISEKTGCKVICGAPTTLMVKGLMMMMHISSKTDQTILYQQVEFIPCFLCTQNWVHGKQFYIT